MRHDTTYTSLVLLRGASPFQFDQDGACVLYGASRHVEARPLLSTWVEFLPETGTVNVIVPHTSKQSFLLSRVGEFLVPPQEFYNRTGLPKILFWAGMGMLDASQLESILSGFTAIDLLVVGCNLWHCDSFISSPMGFKRANSTWSVFAPAGGQLALELKWPQVDPIGNSLSEMRKEVLAGQALYASVDLFVMKLPQQPRQTIFCACESLKEAVTLVIMRMGWGSLTGSVEIPKGAHPAWKRLIQHLGASPETVQTASENSLTVQSISRFVPAFEFDHLANLINRHSRIIPEALLS